VLTSRSFQHDSSGASQDIFFSQKSGSKLVEMGLLFCSWPRGLATAMHPASAASAGRDSPLLARSIVARVVASAEKNSQRRATHSRASTSHDAQEISAQRATLAQSAWSTA
jgi:hypothetical protein